MNDDLALKIINDFKESRHKNISELTVALAIYHDLKKWKADQGTAGAILKQQLITGLEALYCGINLSSAPLALSFGWEVQEWVCHKTGDYGFGITDSRDNSIDSDAKPYEYKLSPINPQNRVRVVTRTSVSNIDIGIKHLLPNITILPDVSSNHGQEVNRQILEALHQFWSASSEYSIPGIQLIYEQFCNTVFELLSNTQHEFNLATDRKGLETYLYLFQKIELGDVYSQESCIHWSYYLKNITNSVPGAAYKSSLFFIGKIDGGAVSEAELQAFKVLTSELNESSVCGNYDISGDKIELCLWQYPDKEATQLTITSHAGGFQISSVSHQNKIMNESQAKLHLMKHFS